MREKVRRLKGTWPPVGRATHNREVAALNGGMQRADTEAKELLESLKRVVPKLVAVSRDRRATDSPDLFRLCIDLDPFLIREAFLFGNDSKAIDYVSDMIGAHVRRELHTVNMHRFESDLVRSRRFGWQA